MTSLPAKADDFRSFNDLSGAYQEGTDYRISTSRGHHSHIAVVAPHGGDIERRTSQIAADIARGDFSCYAFEGIRKSDNYKALHLTSEYFDEPRCLELIAECDRVVTVHGCGGDEVAVLLGGLDKELAALIAEALACEGLKAKLSGHKFTGASPTNVCNRGRTGAGAQLELTAALRSSSVAVEGVVRSVREVLYRLAGAGTAPLDKRELV
jgi:phage replication-related protein YjqB (UPF0714/DUF867 family)